MNDDPADPITSMVEAAPFIHELFLAYQHAGFTEQQAFDLVRVTAAGMGQVP